MAEHLHDRTSPPGRPPARVDDAQGDLLEHLEPARVDLDALVGGR